MCYLHSLNKHTSNAKGITPSGIYSLQINYNILMFVNGIFTSEPYSTDGKKSACSTGDPGSIPGSGRSSREGNGKLLQYSCLENPMDRGAWQATVHEVVESETTEQLTLLYSISNEKKKVWKKFVISKKIILNDLKSKTKKVKHFKDAINQVWAWQLQSIGGKSPTFWKTLYSSYLQVIPHYFSNKKVHYWVVFMW